MVNLVNKVVWVDDALWIVKEQWEGNEDLSYHGSASYETFIKAENLETKEVKTFRSEEDTWHIATDYIKWLEGYKDKVKNKINELYKTL